MALNKNLDLEITDLIHKLKFEEYTAIIREEDVREAIEIIRIKPTSIEELFLLISSLNLLNAAVKIQELKHLIYYAKIKIAVSKLFEELILSEDYPIPMSFYINPSEHCAYIEINKLQFSFHSINYSDSIKEFINSDRNKYKVWKGLRLQKIASDIFKLAKKYK